MYYAVSPHLKLHPPKAVVECVERRGKQLDGLERMWTLADITEESRLQFNLSPHDE